jgi:hypothetical protein
VRVCVLKIHYNRTIRGPVRMKGGERDAAPQHFGSRILKPCTACKPRSRVWLRDSCSVAAATRDLPEVSQPARVVGQHPAPTRSLREGAVRLHRRPTADRRGLRVLSFQLSIPLPAHPTPHCLTEAPNSQLAENAESVDRLSKMEAGRFALAAFLRRPQAEDQIGAQVS